ncbi:M14 family metallopeptidase [Sulfurospirillum barnesii]|uniref:Putative deacylase n=1 Tax=Sulfurospirillum barnesii (strain ATCC 700032 / DSM 10660 / SES-3) TaxID=760154 RepID=I3XW26_SULBS|nr:M14 family metallopeptidase [Sulfurospirillum barnesii]AFL68150.1 putative deacylase [Sulfurospirillum barnesii SES-3]
MREEVLCELTSLSREPLRIKGFRFGTPHAKPSCVIVGPLSGTAIDQLWVASRMVRFLRQKELENPAFIQGEILIVPAVNPYSFNMGKSFWTLDNTDIDTMFPGYDKGETTQRIAAKLFEKINHFDTAILLEARKDRSECIPYVKVLTTGYEKVEMARAFGLEFIYHKEPTPSDTVSLPYNWQIWNTQAFSIVSGKKGTLRKLESAKVFDALIRFLSQKGLINYKTFEGATGNIITNKNIHVIKSTAAGLFDALASIGDYVIHGQPIARVYHSLDGSLLQTILAPSEGVISCKYDYPLIFQNAVAFRIISLNS